MTDGQGEDIGPYRAAITAAFPALAGAAFRFLAPGWHSKAVDVDDRLVFKFPQGAAAEQALVREAALLRVIRPAVSMPVPDLTLHPGPPLFSRHGKLPGEHLVTAVYDRLPDGDRQALARQLARFYAQLHALSVPAMAAAGAGPVAPWCSAAAIAERAVPALPPSLRPLAQRMAAAWRDLPPDPHGTVYGFFDGHGWNMAFDPATRRLNGVYDFADSGFGPLHRDFIYSTFVSPDLTARIVGEYETLTGRRLDRRRIGLLTGLHRLSELAELAGDPDHAPAMVRSVAEWADVRNRHGLSPFP